MMTVAPVASAAGAADYYSSKDNYYFLGDLDSQWLGEGAKQLGLEGPVDLEAFTDLLHGRLPNGVELGREVQGNHVHRPGHDLTFSAPKSVSLLILAGGDRRLLEAHHEAVKETLAIIEQNVSARHTKDGVTSIVPTGKMVAALFTHDTSRNLDPQIHTHAVLANVTELEGSWKALATDYVHGAGFIETVYRHQTTFGKIYRNRLKDRVEGMGFETALTGDPHDMWEIKGIPDTVLEAFSTRHHELTSAVGEDASLKSRDVAALDTRRAKRAPEYYEPAADAPEREVTQRDDRQKAASGPVNDAATTEQAQQMTPGERTEAGRRRLLERWNSQILGLGFDLKEFQTSVQAPPVREQGEPVAADAMQSVREAISVLSDSRTRFTYGDLLMTAHETGPGVKETPALRAAIDEAIRDNQLVPLDREKGVFTSHIHLLDELSVQQLADGLVKEGRVVDFRVPEKDAPGRLASVEHAPLAILNAPSSVGLLREVAEDLVTMSLARGREVQVLTSSAERRLTMAKSPLLQDRLLSRSGVKDATFSLAPHSTLVVEGAERLGLKEMLVLTGEAHEKQVQLLFLDSAGRQANGSAISVLESAGVERHALTEPAPGLEARVISISDKRDRYRALAERFADLSGPDTPVTAVVVGQREQKQLTGIIRDALQNAGKLEREGITVESRTPVFLDTKTRRLAGSYRPGMVLEDRSGKNETRHYTVDRVHPDTRMLSLVDGDGVLSRVKLSGLTGDWRAFTTENISVAKGEQLFALAADKASGLKARDRMTVTAAEPGKLTVMREGSSRAVTLQAGQPLYVTHGWVAAPGSRDNERGVVLASLNSRELNAGTLNALAQSGDRAEIFTGEAQNRAEDRLSRMRPGSSPLTLVQKASGEATPDGGIRALNAGLMNDAQKAVSRAVAQMPQVTFTRTGLLKEAMTFSDAVPALSEEIARQVKSGDLMAVRGGSDATYVARATWEMEKSILRDITDGKGAVTPLIKQVDAGVLDGLTAGQQSATRLVLESADRFTLVQGYAGTGKTTQFRAVKAATDTLPEGQKPVIIGLAPTHRAVKEMRDAGIEAQTMKSFVLDWQQRTAAGEDVRFGNVLFLIDEASMLGNQDTAAAYRAITAGSGRAVTVGDVAQLTSPESGEAFRLQQERSPADVAIMKEIVRQRDADLKSAVYSVIDNRAAEAVELISRVTPGVVPREAQASAPVQSVMESENPVQMIVSDYVSRTPAAREKTMIITQLNADRQAVNAGIHAALARRGELGDREVTVPVLTRIGGGRHDFNRISDWKAGQVVLESDRYLSVMAVDPGTDKVVLRDDDGRTRWLSPAELNATGIEVFERGEIGVREGDSLRFNKTQKAAGHSAHEHYRVEKVKEDGTLTLRSASEVKIVRPEDTLADRHIDYAWAVTGYGAQGASSDFVIALEGTEGARKRMSGMRGFYINVSRAKDHVQVWTDGVNDWMKTLKQGNNGPKTAHDALAPEKERQQAKAIWAMGQPLRKTAAGRTWSKSEGLTQGALTARVIPSTRRFPELHLAVPVYDGNGKTAGLAMQPLNTKGDVKLTGEVRMVTTERAQGAVVQLSRNGETRVVSSLEEALTVARDNPKSGVVWQTGDEPPSAQMLKMSRGEVPQPDRAAEMAARVRSVAAELERSGQVPDIASLTADKREALDAFILQQVRNELAAGSAVPGDIELPVRSVPDLSAAIRDVLGTLSNTSSATVPIQSAADALRPEMPDVALPEGNGTESAGSVPPSVIRELQDELQQTLRPPEKDPALNVSTQALDAASRDLSRRQDISLPQAGERGREMEHGELNRDGQRYNQKER
ncbi:MobF family relaxase [Erwinia persicina]|uniref:Conjugative relaxase n=1 Tax=Erwinia persicina TaxID=55211 RepID=A0ABR8ZZ07_9GAMM|nr:MobF family relaxase [Erwinia persicina]MBD8108942.1 conjugative relaxase [Erwinia persicina]MBD8212039.1 conjugative relaxase [Erwinia persicina]